MVIGKVVRELGFPRIRIGDVGWRWKRVYFTGFRISPDRWINPHMVIVGGSGGGKSNACKMMIRSLRASGANVAVLDPHDEYLGISEGIGARVYDASVNGINIFDLDGMTEKERASEITGMMRRNFRLGEVQCYTLYRCISYAYSVLMPEGKTPNMHNLMFAIRSFKRNARSTSERSVLESLERRMALMDNSAFEKGARMADVMKGSSVFLLSGLRTPEAQSVYMEGFLRKVYSSMLAAEKSDRARLYIVIDEAEKLGDNPIIGKIAAEGRKYGIGIVAISQRAKLVDRDLRGNASMLAAFRIKEPEELNYVANFVSGGNEMGRFTEVKKALRSLPVGSAVVAGPSMNPVIVSFSRNARESVNLRFEISRSARRGARIAELSSSVHGAGRDALLLAVGEMERLGELESCSIDCGRYSGTWYIYGARNSAEHDVAIGIISRRLGELGVSNRIYNSSYGPDIIAYAGREKIAVEYETGSKDIESTARMLESRKTAFAKVVTVVNDSHYDEYSARFSDVVKLSCVDSEAFGAMLTCRPGLFPPGRPA